MKQPYGMQWINPMLTAKHIALVKDVLSAKAGKLTPGNYPGVYLIEPTPAMRAFDSQHVGAVSIEAPSSVIDSVQWSTDAEALARKLGYRTARRPTYLGRVSPTVFYAWIP